MLIDLEQLEITAHALGPLSEGKRSAVAVVNDSPVGCQSRDGTARRRLSAKLTGGVS